MRDDPNDDDALEPGLTDAIRQLREPVPVGDDWRNRLLHDIQDDTIVDQLSARRRGWTVRPALAIAAAIGFMVAGAGGATAVLMKSRAIAPSALSPNQQLASAAAGSAVVRFVLVAPSAQHVAIVGDFNGWDPNAVSLRRLDDGRTWVVELPLHPGRYAYAFMVDGHLTRDPAAPEGADDDFGVTNSVVMVRNSSS